MSSKRGRKRNDNLPPNRARDVQRAFRARRAAHLQALEQRVAELEEENNCLRQALNLPAANRPPLGKGPTGKDRPKPADAISHNVSLPAPLPSRDSSNSPPSTRMSSHSPPSVMDTTVGSLGAVQNVDDSVWDQTIIMSDSDLPSSSASSSYPLPPMSAPPMSSKPIQYSPYPNSLPTPSSLPSSSRPLSSPMYLSSQPNYAHPAERSVGASYGSPTFSIRGDVRDEPPRTQYTYAQSSYQSHETLHSHHNSSNVSSGAHTPSQHQHQHPSARDHIPYAPRRSMTEPQQPYTINQGFPHLPNPMSQGIRLPSPPRLQENHGVHISPRNFGPDGRINSMS
ncbi:hypothetical protein V5O48_004340 [Marasmius crinis-equi]|uniref:BZIP domain-containing protein n=1 Tax=Marasmius crinis-equi TaxID=585013 RepID=A0ABR3FQC6_9AGAR